MWCRTFKVYRAFRELDDFSDEVCDRYVAETFEQSGLTIGCAMALTFIVTLTTYGMAMLVVGRPILNAAAALMGRSDATMDTTSIGLLLLGFALSYWMCTCARNLILRTAIRQRIRITRCPACGYSLLGLHPQEGRVTCPECGIPLTLAQIGLHESDLIPQADERSKAPPS